jgi:hypothetical protein
MPGVLIAAPTHGARTFIPRENFYGLIYMWGAGAGIYGTYANSYNGGGYGGFTWGMMKFRKDIPYTLITGQKGTLNTANSTVVGAAQGGRAYGGGGNGHASSSGGGGLSGIFYNTQNHAGPNASVWPPTGVSQSSALMIAGGGGGGGHGSNTHHGVGGGGGGWSSGVGHSQGRSTQTSGGSGWTTGGSPGTVLQGANANTNTSGGGGGGWWGGACGTHSASHYNGGSGGSGHYANATSNGGNTSLATDIVFAETVSAVTEYNTTFDRAAGANPGYINPGGFYRQRTNPIYNMGAGFGSNSADSFQTDGNIVIVYPDKRLENILASSITESF